MIITVKALEDALARWRGQPDDFAAVATILDCATSMNDIGVGLKLVDATLTRSEDRHSWEISKDGLTMFEFSSPEGKRGSEFHVEIHK
jgi:hypothetical protein